MGRKSHKNMPYMCGACKQGFGSERAVKMHAEDAHPNAEKIGIYKRFTEVEGKDYEPSYGQRAADALLAHAMGEPTDDDWLIDMEDE